MKNEKQSGKDLPYTIIVESDGEATILGRGHNLGENVSHHLLRHTENQNHVAQRDVAAHHVTPNRQVANLTKAGRV